MSLLRQILLSIGLLAALAGYYLFTEHRITAAEARATAAESNVTNLRAELASDRVSDHIVTRFVDRVHTVYVRGATLTQKVPLYVTTTADAACPVPAGFVRLHDAAAAGTEVPDRARAADAAPSGLALSVVAGTVVDNYSTCHAIAEQLTALQDWVRANGGGGP